MHVAVTLGLDTLRLFVNGKEVNKVPSPGDIINDTIPFRLGPNHLVAMVWVSIWNRALDSTEIQNIAGNDLTGSEEGLIACWPMNNQYGQYINDISANHIHLEMVLQDTIDSHEPRWILKKIIDEVPSFDYQEFPYISPFSNRPLGEGEFIDFDSDGDLDFLAIQIEFDQWVETPVHAFMNDGNGNFSDSTEYGFNNQLTIGFFSQPKIADLNGDGLMDAYIPDGGVDRDPFGGGLNRILIQTADGHLEDQTAERLPQLYNFIYGCTLADIDNDGWMDKQINIEIDLLMFM